MESSAARRLRPTLSHTRARHYRRPGGPWDLPSLDMLLSDEGAGARHHRAADDSCRVEGADLERRVAELSGRLRAAGVRHGDAVAWQLPNSVPALLLYRACWRLGAVAAPLHHAAAAAEVEAALELAEPRLVLAADRAAAANVPGAVPVGLAGEAFSALPPGRAVPRASSVGHPSDLAVVLFTSGSTGRAKAVLHTQRGLAWKARIMAEVHGLGPSDVVLMPAPLAHISGLLNGVLLPGAAGMGTYLMARWDPERALDLVEAERVSFMIGPPTFFVSMTAAPGFDPCRVASLRLVSSGGAAVTPAFVDAASDALACRVKRTYGSTEAPTVTTSAARDDPSRARETDGRPVGEVELKVIDPGTGRALPPDRPGELLVRGPELFVGYADPLETAEAHTRGGWFRTGDLATVDDRGWLRVVGRIKDVIIRGGENISTTEVEAVLESHPEVRQAVAVAYPDPVMGEKVAAFVVASASFDLAECKAWFASRGVARFKTPERILHLDAMPTLAAGKPDRAVLRERARAVE